MDSVSIKPDMPLIDVDSELMNLTRSASNCPSKKYVPDGSQCGKVNKEEQLQHGKDCFFTVEDTRISNPACNLRGTGWNRFEWLCLDPQDRVLIPFDYNISNRIVVKDNHRPCIPTPIDVNLSLPPDTGDITCEKIGGVCGAPTGPPSVQWQSAQNAKQN